MLVILCLLSSLSHIFAAQQHTWEGKPPNFLLILADDLGYGDTSVPPFVGSGIRTPELEKMAKKGATLVNYHTAAATCTPTRASILTGLYPWRMGLKAVFEYGQKGSSNRDDWLPRLPTMPSVFAEHNYTTFHSGKWHVGGMRNDDHDMRLLPDKGPEAVGSRRCPHPGPIQQGFQDYVSVLDGPGAPRQNRLQVDATLYRLGCDHLLHNDMPLPKEKFNISGYLSHCEARHAMRVMQDSVQRGVPFYVQVWFHAPHGPWEEIPQFKDWYPDQIRPKSPDDAVPCNGNFQPNKQRYCRHGAGKGQIHDRGLTRFAMYRTMVSDMDKQIGMLLDFVKNLGIEDRTMVVFSSDNGPEDGAGGAGPLRGNKRHIHEGGIRVPSVVQWTGVIPAASEVPSLVVSTDWMPTFLEAAGITLPTHIKVDGHSALTELAPAWNMPSHAAFAGNVTRIEEIKKAFKVIKQKRKSRLHERLVLWHNDFEGPRRTAAWVFDFKVFLDEQELPFQMFDMKVDMKEANNLLPAKTHAEWRQQLSRCAPYNLINNKLVAAPSKGYHAMNITRTMLRMQRTDPNLHMAVVCRMYRSMLDYVQRGDEGLRNYLSAYPELRYKPTPFSDQRPVLGIRTTPSANEELKKTLLFTTGCGKAPCGCSFLTASQVPTLPFPQVDEDLRSAFTIAPHPFVNSSILLNIS